MKIIFSDNTLWGLLNFRNGVITHFISCGYDVTLVAPKDELSQIECIPPKAKYIPICLNRTSVNPFKDIYYIIQLLKIYYSERPDYIIHYTIKPNIYGSIVSKILNIPSLAIITGLGHVFSTNNFTNKIARKLYKFALKFPQKIFTLNQTDKKKLLINHFIDKNQLIQLPGGEGVNLSTFKEIPYPNNQRITFVMVARLLYDKGYAEFVEVAKKLCDKANFYIMGALDSNPTAVPKQIIDHDVQMGYIKHIDFTSNVIPQMAIADCIVLPSYYEGLSRVLMEALAIGRPIICSNIPGCQETVQDGINGFLCQPKSNLSLLDACNKFLALSYNERAIMGHKGRLLAEKRFDEKFVINYYHNLIITQHP